ncbi:MAG: lactate utilization protein [Spirochaetaceae bacterium]|jgi:L-lactate utilization protein LutB|nr:lactate utilization protein [Spirochaetaceae bacterium]
MAKTPVELRNSKLGPRVVEALKKHYFDAWYFDTSAEAVEKIISLIPPGDVVSWGGTVTMDELGIQKILAKRNQPVIDRDTAKTPEERNELQRKALLCDTYLASANALSEDGQLVNIDGNGNRVAAMAYGPRQVIVAAGMNKVAKTVEDALVRARTIAAPLNVQRFPDYPTPCAKTGTCFDCFSERSICNFFVTIRVSRPAGRIKVVLIGEDLGL